MEATGIFKEAAALIMGPVHGRKFTPAAMEAEHARTRLSMPSRWYSGSITGRVTKNVTAPEPSRWTSRARSAVPATMRAGLLPTAARMPSIIGSSIPASVMIPKYTMAKMNIPATAETL